MKLINLVLVSKHYVDAENDMIEKLFEIIEFFGKSDYLCWCLEALLIIKSKKLSIEYAQFETMKGEFQEILCSFANDMLADIDRSGLQSPQLEIAKTESAQIISKWKERCSKQKPLTEDIINSIKENIILIESHIQNGIESRKDITALKKCIKDLMKKGYNEEQLLDL